MPNKRIYKIKAFFFIYINGIKPNHNYIIQDFGKEIPMISSNKIFITFASKPSRMCNL